MNSKLKNANFIPNEKQEPAPILHYRVVGYYSSCRKAMAITLALNEAFHGCGAETPRESAQVRMPYDNYMMIGADNVDRVCGAALTVLQYADDNKPAEGKEKLV